MFFNNANLYIYIKLEIPQAVCVISCSMKNFIFKDSSSFFKKGYHVNRRRWTPARLGDQFVSLGSPAFTIQDRHNMYGLYPQVSSSIWGDLVASPYPSAVVLFDEVTIFEAPTRARSVVWANTEARFVSDWPIAADAGTLLPAVDNAWYFSRSSFRVYLLMKYSRS